MANQPRLHTCPITEPSTSHLDPCLLVEGEEGKEENPQFNPSVGICLHGEMGKWGQPAISLLGDVGKREGKKKSLTFEISNFHGPRFPQIWPVVNGEE